MSADEYIVEGAAVCTRCGHTAPIENGILDLLDLNAMHDTSRAEREQRETQSEREPAPLTELDLAEMEPHLEALRLRADYRILEFGCGSGRYTTYLADRCRLVMGVDISRGSLLTLARRVARRNLALVRADVARFAVRPDSFDAALSTCTSNLPTAEHRHALYRVASQALRDGGSFVSGTHYYGVRAKLSGSLKEGPYKEGGIYRFCTTRQDVQEEISPYFQELRLQPVQIVPPFGYSLRLPLLKVSRICERIAGLREFGGLLMTVARKPVRSILALAIVMMESAVLDFLPTLSELLPDAEAIL